MCCKPLSLEVKLEAYREHRRRSKILDGLMRAWNAGCKDLGSNSFWDAVAAGDIGGTWTLSQSKCSQNNLQQLCRRW